MVKLSTQMRKAMKLYFDTKARGDGVFLVPGDKDRCLDALDKAGIKDKMSIEVVPGLILCHWYDKEKHVTSHQKHNWWACRIVGRNGKETAPLTNPA